MTPPTVIFYTKPNCPLCDRAWAALRAAQARLDFSLKQVNIFDDTTLYERYKHAIPVAEISGREIFRHRADLRALEQILTATEGTP